MVREGRSFVLSLGVSGMHADIVRERSRAGRRVNRDIEIRMRILLGRISKLLALK